MIEIIFYIFQGKKPKNWGGRKDRDKEIRKEASEGREEEKKVKRGGKKETNAY